MGYDCVFDSEELRWGSWEEKLEFDRESKPQVSVFFQKESVVLHADCCGGAVFYDANGNLLHEAKADAEAFFLERLRRCSRWRDQREVPRNEMD